MKLAAALLALFVIVAPTPTQAGVRTVALSGQPAPGTDPGAVFLGLSSGAVINNSGQTAFRGRVSGNGAAGVWSEGSGSLQLVALKGNQAPGAPEGVVFNDFLKSPTLLNDAGQTAFFVAVVGPEMESGASFGIWSEGSGPLDLVALSGTQAAGHPLDVVYDTPLYPALNANGQVVFAMKLKIMDASTVVGGGLWKDDAGTLSLLVDSNATPPGEADGVFFAGFDAKWLALNGNGDIAIGAGVAGPGIEQTENERVWVTRSGELQLVAAAGNHAPGTAPGVRFRDPEAFGSGSKGMYKPSLNDAGQTVFFGAIAGPGIDTSNDVGVWSDGSGTLDLVARGGDHAPGTEETTMLFIDESHVELPPLINRSGRFAFGANLVGPDVDSTNDRGVWSEGFGELELVVRSGDRAPGTADGVTFNSFFLQGFNAAGQAMILGYLVGDGVIEGENKRGLWAQDIHGDLTLIVRSGDLLEVASGDFRTVDLFGVGGYSGNEDGRASSFNDRGEIVFAARFTDGTTGVFVSDRVAIPEPATAVLAVLALMLLAPCRGRRI